MGNRRRAIPIVLLALVTAGSACTFPELVSPSPRPTPTALPSPSPTPATTPSATPTPTAALGAVPSFGAGELIATRIDGLRVRQRPSLVSAVIAGLLPFGAPLEVVMGPLVVGEVGWYLVADASADDPSFDEGWVAAGREPDAYLGSTGEVGSGSRYLASFAGTGDAENGPVVVSDGDHAIRWVAVDPDRVGCSFAVSLAEGSAEPVPAIRATIGTDVVPGTLQPGSFDALGVRGQLFVRVTSDCGWTLVIERIPEATPSPTPSP